MHYFESTSFFHHLRARYSLPAVRAGATRYAAGCSPRSAMVPSLTSSVARFREGDL